ncbi:Aldehyde/histidinol dehydrogenase [Ilyonectria destructans]|nr:Aldehyde/histidinol dehydrogenase [Ilyonectria destructans]
MASTIDFDLNKHTLPLQPFINGKFVDTVDKELHELVSSVNDQVITKELQWAKGEDVDKCVAAAGEALKAWQAMPLTQRRDALIKYGALLVENRSKLHWFEAVLVGKESRGSRHETSYMGDIFNYYAHAMTSHKTDVIEHDDDNLTITVREPYGITAGICAFNAPLGIYAMKTAASLAAGNVIIIKASESNPFSTLFAVTLAGEAGIPDGVIQCVTGGIEAGKAIAAHPLIRKLSFTGSIAAGKAVQVEAAKSNLKSVSLELGGKSPVVVFPDADLDKAAQTIASQLFMFSAQICITGSRIYAHDSIVDELVAKMKGVVDAHAPVRIPGADPMDPNTLWSPIFNHKQHEVVKGFLADLDKESTVVTGGKTAGDKGCYIEPTIVRDPIFGARIEREEVFGPILMVGKFSSEEEALAKANDTETGLTATLWTKDFGRILRFSRRLEAGTIQVNKGISLGVNIPFAGWKQSGQGVEYGTEGFDDWTQVKAISIGA